MTDKNRQTSLCDEISNPIMTVDMSGRLNYKNPAAIKFIKSPRRDALIENYTKKADREFILSVLSGEAECGFVNFKFESFYRRAFAYGYGEGEDREVLLLFHHILRLSAVHDESGNEILFSAFKSICEAVCAGMNSEVNAGRMKYERLQRISEYVEPIFYDFLADEAVDDGHFRYDLRGAAQYICAGADRIFNKSGYRLLFHTEGLPVIRVDKGRIVTLAILLLNMMLFMAEISKKRTEEVSFSYFGDIVTAEVAAFAEDIPEEGGDISVIAEKYPSEFVNLCFLKYMTEHQGRGRAYFDIFSQGIVLKADFDTAYGREDVENGIMDTEDAELPTALLDRLLAVYDELFTATNGGCYDK